MTELIDPIGILKRALEKEQAAYRFYDGLMKKYRSIEIIRETIEQLRDEEYRHIKMIENQITKFDLG